MKKENKNFLISAGYLNNVQEINKNEEMLPIQKRLEIEYLEVESVLLTNSIPEVSIVDWYKEALYVDRFKKSTIVNKWTIRDMWGLSRYEALESAVKINFFVALYCENTKKNVELIKRVLSKLGLKSYVLFQYSEGTLCLLTKRLSCDLNLYYQNFFIKKCSFEKIDNFSKFIKHFMDQKFHAICITADWKSTQEFFCSMSMYRVTKTLYKITDARL